MKKVEHYFYPAIFTYEPNQEIAVTFPDLDCATSGINEDDAFLAARELLGCVLNGLEEDGEDIPSPTPLPQIQLAANEHAVLIGVMYLVIKICICYNANRQKVMSWL